jgi:hypothetical protein
MIHKEGMFWLSLWLPNYLPENPDNDGDGGIKNSTVDYRTVLTTIYWSSEFYYII